MAEQKQNRPRGGGPGRGMSAPVEKAKDFKGSIFGDQRSCQRRSQNYLTV